MNRWFVALSTMATLSWVPVVPGAPDPYQPKDIPEALFAQVEKARDARASSNPGIAVRDLEPIVQSHPNYFLARYNLGLAYEAVSRLDDAITQLKEAKKIDTDLSLGEPTIDNSLGSVYLSAGRFPEAIAELEIASSTENIRKLDSPEKRVVFNNLGLAYSRLNRSCEAAVSYDLASNVPPTTPASTGPAELTGSWIVADWTERKPVPSLSLDATRVSGSLIIEPRRTNGLIQGNLSLCANEPTRSSAFSVHEHMEITVNGTAVRMNGRVAAGALLWSDDHITATWLGNTMTGTAQGNSSSDKVSFERLW